MMTPVAEPFADVPPGLAARYAHLRAINMRLTDHIIKTFDKHTVQRAAKLLGMLREKTIVVDRDVDAALMMEFATYGVFTDGENAVQRFHRSHSQTDPESVELLDAMSQAVFTFLKVVQTYPSEGAIVVDDLFMDNQRILLADSSFSESSSPGDVICARIMHIDNFWMTTGLGFISGISAEDPKLRNYIAGGDPRRMRTDPEDRQILNGEIAAGVVRKVWCLPRKSDEYGDDMPDTDNEAASGRVELLQSERVERNAPCPCGSGKKYKKCCGR